jgi:hypothetical protein
MSKRAFKSVFSIKNENKTRKYLYIPINILKFALAKQEQEIA